MNTLEGIFSFIALFSLIPLFIADIPEESNTSYMHQKLATDIMQVLYLKGDFSPFDKYALNKDIKELTDMTSICISIEEEDIASCLPDRSYVVMERVAFINNEPKIITISFGVEHNDS